MSNKVYVSINSLSDEQKKRLKGVITEVSDSMTRMAAEKDLIKESINDISTELVIEKKLVRKMAVTYFKNSYDKDVGDFQTFEDWYTTLIKKE